MAGRGREEAAGLAVLTMAVLNEGGEVRAAGGVVCRSTASGAAEVLLVHRPRHRDWTFPKGKVEGTESDEECALREVREETGLRCRLGAEIASTRYVDASSRPKVVRYWRMEPVDGSFAASAEVDEVVWLPADAALARLTYDRDIEILRGLAVVDETLR